MPRCVFAHGSRRCLVYVLLWRPPGGGALVLDRGTDLRWATARLLEVKAALPMLREIVSAQAADDKATALATESGGGVSKGKRRPRAISPVRIEPATPPRRRLRDKATGKAPAGGRDAARRRRGGDSGVMEEKKGGEAVPGELESKQELADALG